MSQIGTLSTGAGVTTTIGPLDTLEQYLLLGDVDTAFPLRGLQVEIDGETLINIPASNQPLCSAFAKFMGQMVGSGVIGLTTFLATGAIGKRATLRLTNDGVTTPGIFNFSNSGGAKGEGKPVRAIVQPILAQGNQIFRNFTALLITPSANINSIDYATRDGRIVTMTTVEIDALFALKNQTQTDGRLDAVVSAIDNRDQSIEWVRVNANSSGNVSVLVVDFKPEDWKALKNSPVNY